MEHLVSDPNPELPEMESLAERFSRVGTIILILGLLAAGLIGAALNLVKLVP